MTSFIKIKLPRWIGNKSINWSNFKILKNQPGTGSRLNFFTFDEDVGPLLTFMSDFWVWNPAPLPTTLPWQVFKPLRASFYFSVKWRYNNGTYFTGLLWSFHEFLKWTFARTSSTEYPSSSSSLYPGRLIDSASNIFFSMMKSGCSLSIFYSST